jgi:hypothetical protein
MPYINPSKRDILDPVIDELLQELRGLATDDPHNNMEGNINYVFTRVLKQVYPGGSYREINDALGVVTGVTQEYYRKVAAPYESQKEFENGEVK